VNQKRRLLVILTLAVVALPPLGAETVIDQLYGLRHYELADAYWSAGQRFADLGQADRAAEFKNKAKRLFPGFVPGQAPAFQAVPVAAPEVPHVPEVATVREQNLQGQKIARLQFQKLLRGYLTGTATTVTSVLAPTVEVQGQASSPSAASVAAFLEAHPAEAGAPDDLYRVETLEVADGTGQRVVVTVAANPEATGLAEVFPFWKDVQVFTFDRVGDSWKLVQIEGR